MSVHERSLPWLVCFQCLLPWPSTLLDPSAFLVTNMVNLGEEEMKAFHPLPKLPRYTHRKVGTNTPLCRSEYWFKTKKGTSKHLFSSLGPQSRTKGLCYLKGLRSTPVHAGGAASHANSRGGLSFLPAVPGPEPAWLCERRSGSKRCGKSLSLQVFFLWYENTVWRGRTESHPIPALLSRSPFPAAPPINRATQFRATYSKPSPAIFSQAPHLCSAGLGQVNSSTPDTKLVLFQKSVLDHCWAGFIWCNDSGI